MSNGLRASLLVPTLSAALAGAVITLPAGAVGAGETSEQSPGVLTLSSSELSVQVSSEFPQVVSYRHAGGGSLGGRAEPLDSMVLNGAEYAVEAEAEQVDRDEVSYKLTLPELEGVSMEASISLDGNVTTFAIEQIADTADLRVGTIDIPDHDLLSVSSTQADATVASAIVSPDRRTSGDTITPITAETPADPQPLGSAYAIVNTDELAAAIQTNSTYDELEQGGTRCRTCEPTGPALRDNGRIWRQASTGGGQTRVGIWSGQWTYRAADAPWTEELPWAKVVVTPNVNGDDVTDWQDGAVAFRDIAINPRGAERTADRVVTHIPFNFASQATHPFLRTLDDVKRVSLATDGMSQLAVLKGYGSEGHDSAHPDYGGNYNERAGGLRDLNTLVEAGENWGADFGVHVNAVEAYPEADNFSETLVNENESWDWLDQSYKIDQRRDLVSGDIQQRFAQLREQSHPNLEFLYLDVYRSYGWLQERLAKELYDQGWQIGTEWSYQFEEQALWAHWANDGDYSTSGANKGLNSQIIRFIRNGQKDTWNPHPILGSTEIREFEGWHTYVDWNWFYYNIWDRNLPAKFLQQHEIVDWEDDEIRFTGGVRATDAGGRRFYVGDDVVLDGDRYLLPWKTDRGPWKLYHYNPAGGSTTWQLTDRFEKSKSMSVYRLTDQGRGHVADVPVRNGAVTLDAEPNTPYVVMRARGSTLPVKWGEGTLVTDPGFNSGGLQKWAPSGPTGVARNDRGQYEAVLEPGDPASISQRATGLRPGTWAATAQVEVEPGKSRRTTMTVTSGGQQSRIHVDRSTAQNWMGADEKHGSYMQQVEVRFDVPAGADTATLELAADGGDARVKIDNIRVIETEGPRPAGGLMMSEDFEDVTHGWHPFVKGTSGGVTDPRTHIAQRHAPFTQAGWRGKLVDDVLDGEESLKAHEEEPGLVYRTVPQTVRFEAGHRYRVSFEHQSGRSGYYSWVTGYDTISGGVPRSVEVHATPLPEQRETARFSEDLVAGDCGDYWVGLRRLFGEGSEADLIVDNFTVEDLGLADDAPGCGTLDISAEAQKLEPGAANVITTRLTSDEQSVATDLSMDVAVPDGWRLEATSASSFAAVAPGEAVETTWAVTPPADAPARTYDLEATATYTVGGSQPGTRTISKTLSIETIPPPPTSDVFASDLGWATATNGWGPVEKDIANGDSGPGDGPPITLNGVVYDKGLGTHAPSKVRFYLAGNCQTFVSDVGLDDAQASRGSVTFEVLADGTSVTKSPVMRPTTTTHEITADITGAKHVDLVVGDAGDGTGNDHADWAGARFLCTG